MFNWVRAVSLILAFRRTWDMLLYLLREHATSTCRSRCATHDYTARHAKTPARAFGRGNVTTINLGWKNNAFPRRALYKYLRQPCVRWTLQINRLTRMNHIFRSFAIADGGRCRFSFVCLYMCLRDKKNKHHSRTRCSSRARFAFSAFFAWSCRRENAYGKQQVEMDCLIFHRAAVYVEIVFSTYQ